MKLGWATILASPYHNITTTSALCGLHSEMQPFAHIKGYNIYISPMPHGAFHVKNIKVSKFTSVKLQSRSSFLLG